MTWDSIPKEEIDRATKYVRALETAAKARAGGDGDAAREALKALALEATALDAITRRDDVVKWTYGNFALLPGFIRVRAALAALAKEPAKALGVWSGKIGPLSNAELRTAMAPGLAVVQLWSDLMLAVRAGQVNQALERQKLTDAALAALALGPLGVATWVATGENPLDVLEEAGEEAGKKTGDFLAGLGFWAKVAIGGTLTVAGLGAVGLILYSVRGGERR